MKVVINTCFGGFGLSKEAMDLYCEKKGINPGKWNEKWKFYEDVYHGDIERNDPVLVEVVETLGKKSSGWAAELRIVEIPDGIEWFIDEYDGREHIAEKHRTWY